MSTIAAIVTAPGNAAVSIIRISGDEAWPILASLRVPKGGEAIQTKEDWIAASPMAPRNDELVVGKFKLDWLYDGDQKLDQSLVLAFKSPNSYTGEDVIEIQCHGGYNLSQRILELVLEAGAVLAKPGEFTERAVLNGKMDLSQAESIMDLIEARSDKARENAIKIYQGELGSEIKTIRNNLLNLLGELTACIDFPDEVEDYDRAKYQELVAKTVNKIETILESEQEGHILREGYKVAIVGEPNAGKSTLLNALLKKERAIVTEIAGTTRDLIEESYSIKGLPIVLLDTAGIRESSDEVERIGIERSREAMASADLIVVLSDLGGNREWGIGNGDLAQQKAILKIGTKLDCVAGACNGDYDLAISAKEGTNIEELKNLIYSRVLELSSESKIKINHRQADLLRKAKDALTKSQTATELAIDFWTIDLRAAIAALGEITGETLTEELLDNIFSRFCIGK